MIEMGEQRQGRKRTMFPSEGPTEGRQQNGGPLLALANGTTTTTTVTANGRTSTTSYAPPEAGLINEKLPKELLLKIFSFLDIVSLCRFVTLLSISAQHNCVLSVLCVVFIFCFVSVFYCVVT